jgi:hypothetical protein
MTGPAGATRALTRSPDFPAPRHASLAGFHTFTPGYYGWDDAGTGQEEMPPPPHLRVIMVSLDLLLQNELLTQYLYFKAICPQAIYEKLFIKLNNYKNNIFH